jgi:hypothetical protein
MSTNLNVVLTNNILSHTANIHNTDDIDNMINLKKNIHNNIFLHRENIEELQKLINLIDDKLMKKCNHQWGRDYTYCGEHSQYKCSVCGLCK